MWRFLLTIDHKSDTSRFLFLAFFPAFRIIIFSRAFDYRGAEDLLAFYAQPLVNRALPASALHTKPCSLGFLILHNLLSWNLMPLRRCALWAHFLTAIVLQLFQEVQEWPARSTSLFTFWGNSVWNGYGLETLPFTLVLRFSPEHCLRCKTAAWGCRRASADSYSFVATRI